MTNPNDNSPNDPKEPGAGQGGYGESYRGSGQEGYGQGGYRPGPGAGGSEGYGQGGYQEGYGAGGYQFGAQGGYQEGYGQGGYGQGGYGQGGYGAYGSQSAPSGGKPQNFMVPSIIATIGGFLFCCLLGLPAGIAAIVFGNKVDSLWNMGDYQGAQAASEKAKLWMIVAAVLAGLGLIANIILFATGSYDATFNTY
ncbi:CD225/dispanin family protein [Corynebacterium xerosis]|uniref:CD225/dispanin family protein n=1 Tax=Corynebacterium xerosis TaxID=1725 RepID=A0ABV3UQ65_9CORY